MPPVSALGPMAGRQTPLRMSIHPFLINKTLSSRVVILFHYVAILANMYQIDTNFIAIYMY